MKVYEFINQLQDLKPELLTKEIVIVAPNGLEFEPVVKLQPFDYSVILCGSDKIKNIVITYE
jgi:hypothetical protein